MKIFGKCFHRWKKGRIYFDYSDICIWSNGFVYYKYCKDCGKLMKENEWLGEIECEEIPKDSCNYKPILKKAFGIV